jgi:hypothetical protein
LTFGGRDLMKIFAYRGWDKFRAVIERAFISSRESGVDPAGHFRRSDG